ncbi:MAG: hypothetical protein JNL61_09390 [Rhizobiaceae bacterium]|nr:hypothetical protein [Rhizobiaceae bacterium]
MNLRLTPMAALLFLGGCATGGLDGATASDKAPQSASAAIVGAMNGGLVGGSIGADLVAGDRRMALEAEYRALEYTPVGQPVRWKGASAGVYGEVVAAAPYRVGSQDCRQYTQTVTSNGNTRTARGTACRNPDGSWTPLT